MLLKDLELTLSSLSSPNVLIMIPNTMFRPIAVTITKNDRSNIIRTGCRLEL